ncbi:hypothetical protein N7528_000571 [Penicillium herquei]|nr:hypothetical protein N7528_000571 [Penicillium herquei]
MMSSPQASHRNAPRPRVMVLGLYPRAWYREIQTNLTIALSQHADIQCFSSSDQVINTLTWQPLLFKAVYVTDEAIASPENIPVWHSLVRYMRSGGTVILTERFGQRVNRERAASMFRDVNKQWELGKSGNAEMFINTDHIPQRIQAALPQRYMANGCFVSGASQDEAWYRLRLKRPAGDKRSYLGFASLGLEQGDFLSVMTSVGHGKLGYVGDSVVQEETHQILVAMAGLT